MSKEALKRLIAIHEYCRPHGSESERQFIKRFIEPLGASRDAQLNWHVRVGKDPKVLWSCHTDTVHRFAGFQRTHYDPASGVLSLGKRHKKTGSCLGADDGAGVFLMTEMIRRQVPGHYVFHYGEESGGIGSSALARVNGSWLKQFQMAIALDRKGYSDVITHQGWSRCASNAFAKSLAAGLNDANTWFNYKPSDGGIYTDTAEYTEDIPECTNLSVGYKNAHSSEEELDVFFLFELLEALCALDTTQLVIERDPAVIDDDDDWDWRRVMWTPKKLVSKVASIIRPKTQIGDEYECRICGELNPADNEVCFYCGEWTKHGEETSAFLDPAVAAMQEQGEGDDGLLDGHHDYDCSAVRYGEECDCGADDFNHDPDCAWWDDEQSRRSSCDCGLYQPAETAQDHKASDYIESRCETCKMTYKWDKHAITIRPWRFCSTACEGAASVATTH